MIRQLEKGGIIFRLRESVRQSLTPAAHSLLAGLLCLASGAGWAATSHTFEIKLAKPEFVLPRFSGPYTEREASIAPEEYEMAETLQSLLESGQRDEVLAQLETYYEIELSPAMLALKAQVYSSLEMYDKAETTYLSILNRSPQLVRVHSDLGQLYLIREQFEKSRAHFANAVAFGSNDALVHGQLAYLNLTLYGPYSAISGYQTAMAIEPENVQWQRGLLASLTQAQMYNAAHALLRELISRRPEEPELWLNRAALAMQDDDPAQALASMEMANLLGDTDRDNLKATAQLHLQLGSYQRALALLKNGVARQSLNMSAIKDSVGWLLQTNMLAEAQELLDQAQNVFDKMSNDDRSNYFLLSARLSAMRNEVQKADRLFTQSLEANPVNGEALLAYADSLRARKNHTESELLYIRAEAIRATEQKAMRGRAQLYIEMQDYTAALRHLTLTLKKYPDLVDLHRNIEIIENILQAKR